jgi:hypothetical protein
LRLRLLVLAFNASSPISASFFWRPGATSDARQRR